MNRISQISRFLRETRRAIELNEQRKLRLAMRFASPADDEFFRGRIQIALAKGRRVDRVEELFQLADMNFDEHALGGNLVAGGEPRRRAPWSQHLRR